MKFFLYIFLLVGIHGVYAQNNFNRTVDLKGIQKIEADFAWGDVLIRNYEGSEIQVLGNVSINLHENDAAFTMDFTRNEGVLRISSGIKDWKKLPHYVTFYQNGQKTYEKVGNPDEVNWDQIKSKYKEAGNSYSFGPLIEIQLTIMIPEDLYLDIETEYGSLEVMDCKNPLALKAVYGHLVAEFTDRPVTKDCSLESTYSFVDISLPSSAKYDLTLQTNFGEIYSDLDFNIDKTKSTDEIFESKVIAAMNNGGASLEVMAKYNNIYLRKKG